MPFIVVRVPVGWVVVVRGRSVVQCSPMDGAGLSNSIGGGDSGGLDLGFGRWSIFHGVGLWGLGC